MEFIRANEIRNLVLSRKNEFIRSNWGGNRTTPQQQRRYLEQVDEYDKTLVNYFKAIEKINLSEVLIRTMCPEEKAEWAKLAHLSKQWHKLPAETGPKESGWQGSQWRKLGEYSRPKTTNNIGGILRTEYDNGVSLECILDDFFPKKIGDKGRKMVEGTKYFSIEGGKHHFGDNNKNKTNSNQLEIKISDRVRFFLKNYLVPDSISGGVPVRYKKNPRFKIEHNKVTIAIPEGGWAEFLCAIGAPYLWNFD